MAAQSLIAVPLGLEPMEAKLVTELPENSGWQFEPKWDGFRCLAYRAEKEVDLQAKSGKTLARYFPEIVALLAGLPQRTFVVDGELAIPTGDSLSFNALQMRIHPAESRIRQPPRAKSPLTATSGHSMAAKLQWPAAPSDSPACYERRLAFLGRADTSRPLKSLHRDNHFTGIMRCSNGVPGHIT